MAKYTCSKCGQGMDSKCQFQRHIFPDNNLGNLLDNRMTITEKSDGRPGLTEFTISVPIVGETKKQALKTLASWIMEPGVLDYISCGHDWVLQAKTCDLGCCHKEEVA